MIKTIWQPEFQQALFRRLLDAFSRPGKIIDLPACHGNAVLAVLATLVDGESSLADPHNQLVKTDWLRLQLKKFSPELASFVACQGVKPVDFEPNIGTLVSPEQGATLILSIDALEAGENRYRLTGPGIEFEQDMAPKGLDTSWFNHRTDWNSTFPLGVDMLLVANDHALSLPRTTYIKALN